MSYDIYRSHLNQLMAALMEQCSINNDWSNVKTDPRSQQLRAQAKGIQMALEAYEICMKVEEEFESKPDISEEACSSPLNRI